MATGSTPSRDNFFILLELNPDAVWDTQVYVDALKRKKDEWNKQGAQIGQKALLAKKKTELIPQIEQVMTTESLRLVEAEAARVVLQSGQEARLKELETQILFINAKDSIEQKELDKLIDDFKDVLSAKAIRDRVKVPIRQPIAPTTSAQLDPTTAKNIDDRLKIIGVATLYDLLELPRTTAAAELHRVAAGLYIDLVGRVPKTSEVTTRTELAGFAKTTFETEEKRRQYDATLRLASLNLLLKRLDEIMSRTSDKEVSRGQIDLFLIDARKVGWQEQEALEKLKERAVQRKWFLQTPKIDENQKKLVCGNCGTLNDGKQNRCTNCARELHIECPNCSADVDTEHIACGNCGFPVGNRQQVDNLLEVVKAQLAAKNIVQAQATIQEAEALWIPKKSEPRLTRIREYRQKIDAEVARISQSRRETEKQLSDLIVQKKFFAAQQFLSRRRDDIPDSNVQQRIIDNAINQAENLLKRVYASSSRDERIDLCRQALANCSDYKDALDVLKTMPPSMPTMLQAQGKGLVVSLSWHPSPTRDVVYRIVRKSGARPNSATDGNLLQEVTGLTYDDVLSDDAIGVPLYYAVFASYDGIVSTQGAMIGQAIFVVQNVVNPIAHVNSNQVELSWKTPKNAHVVVIVRNEQKPPTVIHDGVRVAELMATQEHFIDHDVLNEHVYYYGIYSQFKDAEGRTISSSGAFIRVTPETPPAPITHIDITHTKVGTTYEIQICWERPKKGDVVILKSGSVLPVVTGQLIAVAQLSQLGQALPVRAETATDTRTRSGVSYYTPVVVLQTTAYVGTSQKYVCVDKISDLRYQNLGASIRLQWHWPDNCQEALVLYSMQGWPEIHDPTSVTHKVSCATYDHLGYFDVRGTVSQDYYIAVSAIIQDGKERVVSPEERCLAHLVSKFVMNYEIKNPTLFHKKRTLTITARTPGTLPVLVLVSRRDRLPFRKSDGDVFQRIEPTVIGEKELIIELPEQKFPPRTFGKLFLEDDALNEVVTIHHPGIEKLRMS